jgi:hypothetical protein
MTKIHTADNYHRKILCKQYLPNERKLNKSLNSDRGTNYNKYSYVTGHIRNPCIQRNANRIIIKDNEYYTFNLQRVGCQ